MIEEGAYEHATHAGPAMLGHYINVGEPPEGCAVRDQAGKAGYLAVSRPCDRAHRIPESELDCLARDALRPVCLCEMGVDHVEFGSVGLFEGDLEVHFN